MSANERLGQALQRIGEDDLVEGNEPERLEFRVMP